MNIIKETWAVVRTAVVMSIVGLGCNRNRGIGIPGVYHGSHFGGTEVINIAHDGTFTQTFTEQSRTHSCAGTWRIIGSRILFTPFIYLLVDGRCRPHKVDSFSTKWDSDSGKLYFSEDDRYMVSK